MLSNACETRNAASFPLHLPAWSWATECLGTLHAAASFHPGIFFVLQVPNDDPMLGSGTSLPGGEAAPEGEEAELTEEQIAKNKEAEEAFKVRGIWPIACIQHASNGHHRFVSVVEAHRSIC